LELDIPGEMKMNIYLDIDGVILGVESPIEDLIKFISYILDNFPDSTYWLTTHCMCGENHTDSALRGVYPDELVDRIAGTIKPTDWRTEKTEAIDFSQPFVWFDDDAFESEWKILELHGALDGQFHMNLRDPKMAEKALGYLQSLQQGQP
jgi:hypothetical protein